RVALIVGLDEPKTSRYGGVSAAPIFQRIGERWISTFPDLARERSIALAEGQQAPPDEGADSSVSRDVPDVKGLPAAVASTGLLAQGFVVDKPDVEDAVMQVISQSPRPGMQSRPGAQVRLAVDTEAPEATQNRMPDLKGLSARQAMFWLAKRGVRVRVEGHGRVVSQSPAAGKEIQNSAVIRCK
ncbi:MAG: PASTA domain-containing protein, partial [Rhodothermales bacterium]|nr:PASTA domain-containing protein [Rhodothermales bacterium]